MKTFKVTKRGPSGKFEETVMEAGDREALFAELTRRGISAIKVEEVAAGVKAARRPVSGRVVAWIAIVAVAALAVAAWLLFPRGEGREAPEPARKPAAVAKPAPSAPPPKAEEPPVDDEAKERERRRAAYMAMTPDERWAFVVERAKRTPLREMPGTNRIFRTSTEQVMDWIFSCQVGDPPPLLPNLPLKERLHLADILISDNPVGENDSERAKEAKETVRLVKKEFRDFIMEGGEPEEFLPYYHGQLVQAHEEWKMSRKMVMEAVKENPDIAAEFISKVNEGLEKKGIKKVTLPPKMLEHYGIELTD